MEATQWAAAAAATAAYNWGYVQRPHPLATPCSLFPAYAAFDQVA